MHDINKNLYDLLERAQSWPESARSELERYARDIESELKDGLYRPTAAESLGIERGLRAATEGNFATDTEVDAVFARLRNA